MHASIFGECKSDVIDKKSSSLQDTYIKHKINDRFTCLQNDDPFCVSNYSVIETSEFSISWHS